MALVRLRPFDTTTTEGRASERLRRVALTAIASALAQAASVVTAIVSVPLTIGYLGTERYGLWMTISSLIAFLAFSDLGIGNGLVNAIAEANGRDDQAIARRYVSTTFCLLTCIGALLTLAFAVGYPWISWRWLFNVTSPEAVVDAGPGVAAFVICYMVGLPVSVAHRVQMGYQEGFVNSLWQAAGSLLGLVGLLVAVALKARLHWLIVALAGAPILANGLNSIVLYGVKRPWLRPRLGQVALVAGRRVLRIGVVFFALQLANALGVQLNSLIIARFLGADQVTHYAVPLKLFMLVPMLLSLVLLPLWPAYGEAIARNDVAWVRRTFRRSLTFGIVCSALPTVALVLFGKSIIRLWAGPTVETTPLLLGTIGVWSMLSSINGPIAALLNGGNVIGFQVVCAVLTGGSSVGMSVVLVRVIGLPGPILACIISQVVFTYIPFVAIRARLFNAWESRAAQHTSNR